jgi:hypothetical protein
MSVSQNYADMPAEAIPSLYHENIRNRGHAEAGHGKCKELKLGGGQA